VQICIDYNQGIKALLDSGVAVAWCSPGGAVRLDIEHTHLAGLLLESTGRLDDALAAFRRCHVKLVAYNGPPKSGRMMTVGLFAGSFEAPSSGATELGKLQGSGRDRSGMCGFATAITCWLSRPV